MKRIAVFTLVAASIVSWSMPAKAQGTGVAKYARQSKKASKKAAKDQRKLLKKYTRAQQEAAKKAKRNTRYRAPARNRLSN